MQEKYVKEQREKQALTLKVESLQTRNYELVGKMEVMRNLMQTPHAATPELATGMFLVCVCVHCDIASISGTFYTLPHS